MISHSSGDFKNALHFTVSSTVLQKNRNTDFLCLLLILHDMKIHVQERANLKKETLQLRYLMEHSCFDINEFKDNPEDISFFTGFSAYQTMMLCYDITKGPAKNLS